MLQGDEQEGTITEHLQELRLVLIKSFITLLLLFPFCYCFSENVTALLIRHFCKGIIKLRYFSPIEPFLIKIKISFYCSLLISFPYIAKIWWSFFAPAFRKSVRRLFFAFILLSWLLFITGGLFAGIYIMPLIMKFSLSFQTSYLEPAIGISQFIGLLFILLLGFGFMFQIPVVIFILIKAGFVNVNRLKKLRAYVFVLILIISAVLTPPDFVSQLLMAIPTYLLFEAGLMVASVFAGNKQ